jgi:hypothetical protein
MKENLTQRILEARLVEGDSVSDKEIAIRIDHTLKGIDKLIAGK